jgi:predicted DNA-binding protein
MDSPRISPKDIPQLDRLAKRRGVPMTLLVNEAIAAYLAQQADATQPAVTRSRPRCSGYRTRSADGDGIEDGGE